MEIENSIILFADIKGYSKLNRNEIERFHSKVMPVLADRLSGHGWKYCNTWGDAIVIAGNSARALANMALDLRDFFQAYDWASSELPRLDIRVSVHSGEHWTGDDPFTNRGLIVGQSVVLAARVEPVTMPGQIWITEDAKLAIARVDDAGDKRFGLDVIGDVVLPKGYPKQLLFLLRRSHEPQLTDAEKAQILEENLRRAEAEKDSESKLLKGQFTVVVGIVLHEGKVALVKRRENAEHFSWMFPSGTLLPLQDPEHCVWREVKEETGLSCRFVRSIGSRQHPRTGLSCEYFLLAPIGDAIIVNADPLENDDALWVPVADVAKLIGNDLFEEVRDLLTEESRASG